MSRLLPLLLASWLEAFLAERAGGEGRCVPSFSVDMATVTLGQHGPWPCSSFLPGPLPLIPDERLLCPSLKQPPSRKHLLSLLLARGAPLCLFEASPQEAAFLDLRLCDSVVCDSWGEAGMEWEGQVLTPKDQT